MTTTNYDSWAIRINDAIRRNRERAGAPPLQEVLPVKDLLLRFAREASLIAGAIGRNVDDVAILGADRYETLTGFLEQMLGFDDFSFFEFRYKIPDKREPGLRFKVLANGESSRVVVQYYDDLIAWPVDEAGNRLWTEPVTFEIGEGRIDFVPHMSLAPVYAGCGSWQAALRETLVLPLKFLYNSSQV